MFLKLNKVIEVCYYIPALKLAHHARQIWLVGSVVADVMIVMCMLYTVSVCHFRWRAISALMLELQLQQAKAKTYFVETKDLLSKLSRQTVQTGLIATVIACMELGFYLGFHVGDVHTGP